MAGVPSRKASIAIKLSVWTVFVVIIGLLPILVDMIRSGMSPHGLDFAQVLGRGELYLVGAVIAAGSIGELVETVVVKDLSVFPTWLKVVGIFICGFTVVALAANTIAYMADASPKTIQSASPWFFLATVIPSGMTIGMVAAP
ncbi:hypothetical protein [Mycobacterium malmoense]|uniref:hypothetical protein n=1 Tax=Mycobacterium malmoense TaxID=1780 RepID=UPI0011310129|nr:hypothetical protein [Mycobacterium malmoense]